MPTTPRILFDLIRHHPANRSHVTRALARAIGWQLYKRTLRVPFETTVYGALKFRCYPDSEEPGRLFYYGGLPDYDEMLFMMRYLRPGDSVIDAGAHHGLYTLLAAALVRKTGHVDAIE